MKNLNNVDLNKVISFRLSQSKLYLNISYFIKDTNLSIIIDIIEIVIKSTHIFNNTILVPCLQIIKTSSKSNMTVI